MILGITGYIGSGKSYVSNLFRKNNIPVYDTDSKAKEILNTNHQLKQELKDYNSCAYKHRCTKVYRTDGNNVIFKSIKILTNN